MKIYVISIFPHIFDSFLDTSLIKKAQQKNIIQFETIDPRDFALWMHRQVDDTVYGWWEWLLMKAQPIIDALESCISRIVWDFMIIYPSPSSVFFDQNHAKTYAQYQNIIFLCGRYEWIDARVELYINDHYPMKLQKLSLWRFVVYGWEVPSMIMIEAITRMVPWCIHQIPAQESYDDHATSLLEYPQYTKPAEIHWYQVPDVLMSGHHQAIQDWKETHFGSIL